MRRRCSGATEDSSDTPAVLPPELIDPDTSLADYVWLPLRFEGEMAFVDWYDEWRDPVRGQPGRSRSSCQSAQADDADLGSVGAECGGAHVFLPKVVGRAGSAVDQPHARFVEAVAGGGGEVVQAGERLGGRHDGVGGGVLLDAGDPLGAGNRGDVVALGPARRPGKVCGC
jgi:hypothetical protein